MEKKNRNIMLTALSAVPALSFTENLRSALLFALSIFISALTARLISYPLTRKSSKSASFILTAIVNVTVVSGASMVLSGFFYSVFYSLRVYYVLSALSASFFISLFEEDGISYKDALLDTLSVMLLYGFVVIVTALLREIIGSGSVFGKSLFDALIPTLSRPGGAFFSYGVSLALVNAIYIGKEKRK